MLNHRVQLPDHSAEFRRCLVDCDVSTILKLWKHVFPSMPAPETDEDALICIHMTRTATERLPFRFRAYSHRWLEERGVTQKCRSLLPDELKPKAERMYPRIVSAVGVCVASMGNRKTDYHHAVSTEMCHRIEDLYADGIEDPVIVKANLKEIHDRMRRQR
jgi:hypothetical protein